MPVPRAADGGPRPPEAAPEHAAAPRDGPGPARTKLGRGIGARGACTVHMGGAATRACPVPLGEAEGSSITTIEGLSSAADPAFAHPFHGLLTTAESFSTRAFREPARKVGAQACEMLRAAAAETRGVYPDGPRAEGGHVVEPISSHRLAPRRPRRAGGRARAARPRAAEGTA